MAAKREALLVAGRELEQIVAQMGSLPEWRARLDPALAHLEEGVRERGATLVSQEGLMAGVDRPRLPCPTVDREEGRLRTDLGGLLEEIQSLRAALAGPGPAASADLIERARRLTEGVRRYRDSEAQIVLESVNMDIGAGD